MTPQEIAQLKQESPALRQALKARGRLYPFLREQVIARFGYYPQGAHICERCGKQCYPTLKSPYNAFHPGWCIDCVLRGFFDPDTPMYDEYADPHSPKYDRVYANNKRVMAHWYDIPDDYDGPPIVMA